MDAKASKVDFERTRIDEDEIGLGQSEAVEKQRRRRTKGCLELLARI